MRRRAPQKLWAEGTPGQNGATNLWYMTNSAVDHNALTQYKKFLLDLWRQFAATSDK